MNKLIKKYNSLNNKVVKRSEIVAFFDELFDELPNEDKTIRLIWEKIGNLLEQNPDTKSFEITIAKHLTDNIKKSIAKKRLKLSKKSNQLRLKRNKSLKNSKSKKAIQLQIDKLDKKRDELALLLGETPIFKKPSQNKKGLSLSVSTLKPEMIYFNVNKPMEITKVVDEGLQFTLSPEASVDDFKKESTSKDVVSEPQKNIEIKPEKQQSKVVNKSIPKGFTLASDKPDTDNLPGLFYLPGEIGLWLQKQQRYRLMLLVHGESGSGKSELVKQLTNSFIEAGFKGGFFDLEQGGLQSKDTQDSIERNIPNKNLDKIAFTDDAENGLDSVKSVANNFDFIVVDSYQKLNDPMSRLDELRREYPNTIWIIITQETHSGKAKGGSQTMFDPPLRIKVFKQDNTFINNYAEIMKNRGNQNTVGTRYNVFSKKMVSNEDIENKEENVNSSLVISTF